MVGTKIERLIVNDLNYAVHVSGEGPAILCLHGFPDSAKVWRELTPLLVAGGYRVIAPDLRGFGETDAPVGVRHYKLARIAEDCLEILDALGIREPVNLLGHDWGAALGWVLAINHPERFRKYVTLSVGHISAFAYAGPRQLLASRYMVLFQLSGLAEWIYARKDFRYGRGFTKFPEEDAHQVGDLARPGRLRAGMSWYRANLVDAFIKRWGRCSIPVLGIWSDGDIYLTEGQIRDGTRKYMDADYRYARIEGASHWVQLQKPREVAELSLAFFGDAGGDEPS